MERALELTKKVFDNYKKWVVNNPLVATDLETAATWSSYFIVGKINKSPIVSEYIYSLSKLLSLYNDLLIRRAWEKEMKPYSLQEDMKLWLTVVYYIEVFVELLVKSRWGVREKHTVITLIQLFKSTTKLMLLFRHRELPIAHPAIAPLNRKKLVEAKDMTDENKFFELGRSGRIVRVVSGAPPVFYRDWEPVRLSEQTQMTAIVEELYLAETIHILKPLIHLVVMRIFGQNLWPQWVVALGLDVVSLRKFIKHVNQLSHEQKLEVNRRKLALLLYLLRSPMYNVFSRNIIERSLTALTCTIPALSFVTNPLLQYLNHWQRTYFYMWSS